MKRLLVMVAAALVLSACNKDCEPQAPSQQKRSNGNW